MKIHDKSTRNLFNQIHLSHIADKVAYNRIKNSLDEKILKLDKNYFKGKKCADLGCGSTGSGGLNLLNLGAKYCHFMVLKNHIIKPIKKNLRRAE